MAALAGIALGVGFVLLVSAESPPAPERPVAAARLFPVHVERIKDADTIVGTIQMPWNVALYRVTIRADYDACERTRRRRGVEISQRELIKGEEAARSLELALQSGELYASPMADAYGMYGRVQAVLWIERHGRLERLSDWMRQRGYLRDQLPGARKPGG